MARTNLPTNPNTSLDIPLEALREEDLRQLEANAIPEGLRLEYKRQLALNTAKEKAEAAKDITALANTDGGRIYYGISETKRKDVGTVAGPITPLTDETVDSRLRDIIAGNCHPRPRLTMQRIPVSSGGFVLAVEIYPSFGQDLYMVTGFDDCRFYRRSSDGTQRMTEPEIREAYARIAISRRELEATIEPSIREELCSRPDSEESVLVIPWFARPDLVKLRNAEKLTQQLLQRLPEVEGRFQIAANLRIHGGGFLSFIPTNEHAQAAHSYLSVRKTGIVHYSRRRLLFDAPREKMYRLLDTAESILAALETAHIVLDTSAYWGPVRIIHRLQLRSPSCLLLGNKPEHGYAGFPQGNLQHTVYETNLRESGQRFGPVLRELLDQISNHVGQPSCPWFDESGKLAATYENYLLKLSKYFPKAL